MTENLDECYEIIVKLSKEGGQVSMCKVILFKRVHAYSVLLLFVVGGPVAPRVLRIA
jgi:hypothetical protein